MTNLKASELHLHRTSCLTGGEFPCPVALPPEPYDPLWDGSLYPILDLCPQHIKRRKVLLLD